MFVAQGSGAVVNVASLLSFQGGILVSSYATAKHGVLGLTRALANEWAPHGVRVNAVAPGYIATDFNQRLRDDPVRYQEMLDRIPAGRWGTPDDLAGDVRLPLLARQRVHDGPGRDGRRRLDEPLSLAPPARSSQTRPRSR